MPCVGFIHPLTRKRGGFDMFDHDTTRNGRPAFPPWMANLIGKKVAEDVRHAQPGLTATRTLGCPRQVYIETLFDWHIDPGEAWVMYRGTALHEIAAVNWPDSYLTEARNTSRLTVEGELFGTRLSALIDATKNGKAISEIIDLKFPRDESDYYRKRQNGGAKHDHAVQLNIGRLLLAQQDWAVKIGYDPDTVKLTIWDHACGTSKYPATPEPLIACHMTEEAMLEHKPSGGKPTVRDIVGIHIEAARVYAEAEGKYSKEQLCAALPLTGRTQFGGKKCTNYCSVEPICSKLVREYGEPE